MAKERERELRYKCERVCTLGCIIIKRKKKEKASMPGGKKEKDLTKGGEKDSMLRREKVMRKRKRELQRQRERERERESNG